MISEQLAQQNHNGHTLQDSPLLDYTSAAIDRNRLFAVNPQAYYRIRVTSHDGKLTRHAFLPGITHTMHTYTAEQSFGEVLEEIASTRNWQGENVDLIATDPTTGEEYRLNSGKTPL
jgi:hypothetical protein